MKTVIKQQELVSTLDSTGNNNIVHTLLITQDPKSLFQPSSQFNFYL